MGETRLSRRDAEAVLDKHLCSKSALSSPESEEEAPQENDSQGPRSGHFGQNQGALGGGSAGAAGWLSPSRRGYTREQTQGGRPYLNRKERKERDGAQVFSEGYLCTSLAIAITQGYRERLVARCAQIVSEEGL